MSGGGGQADHSEGGLIMGIFFIIGLGVLLQFLSEYYIYAWYYIKYPLVKGLFYIPDTIRPYLFFWIELIPQLKVPDLNLFAKLLNQDFDQGVKYIVAQRDIGFFDIGRKSMVINYIILPFISIPLLLLIKSTSSTKTYNKSLSMAEFRVQEAERWPVIKPIIHLEQKVVNDINNGPWAMSMRPEVFYAKNDYLIFLEEDDNSVIELKDKEYLEEYMRDYNFTIDSNKVRENFLIQLGDPWEGINKLSIDEKHLLSILLPKINRDGNKTREMLDLFGNYYTSEKGRKINKNKKNLEKIINKNMAEIFSKYFNTKLIQSVIKRHHFKNTVFASLLEEARKDGVLSNGLFVWLKPLNRTLWFMMCSTGRKLPLPDAAGPWSHFLSEKALNAAITLPRITAAVDSVDIYFSARYKNYIPFKELDKKDD
jgi:intracellular multiplication protein IcmP